MVLVVTPATREGSKPGGAGERGVRGCRERLRRPSEPWKRRGPPQSSSLWRGSCCLAARHPTPPTGFRRRSRSSDVATRRARRRDWSCGAAACAPSGSSRSAMQAARRAQRDPLAGRAVAVVRPRGLAAPDRDPRRPLGERALLRPPHRRGRTARVRAIRRQRLAGLGEHRIAVVLPTNTWQAYNFCRRGPAMANPTRGIPHPNVS